MVCYPYLSVFVPFSVFSPLVVPCIDIQSEEASADASVNYEEVRKDIEAILEDPAYDDGSLGPVLLRLAWHAAGTYDASSNSGGSEYEDRIIIEIPHSLTRKWRHHEVSPRGFPWRKRWVGCRYARPTIAQCAFFYNPKLLLNSSSLVSHPQHATGWKLLKPSTQASPTPICGLLLVRC